jgi:hypothetical protein
MLLSGPRTQTLGTEPTLTCNYVAKSGGGDHLYDSCIFDNGTTTCIKNNLVGTGTACFASNVCAPTIVVNNTNPVLYINSGNNETATIGFTQGAVTGYGGFIKVSTGLGDRSMTFGLSAAGTNNDASTLVRLDDSGVTCFSNTICAPSFIGGMVCGTTATFATSVTTDNLLTIAYADISNGSNRGLRIVNTDATEGTAYNITAGRCGANNGDFVIRNTTTGVNNLVFNRSNGVACFSNTICAASTHLGGCASIGGTTYDFGFEVFSSKNTAITSDNTFGANFNLIFNRNNVGSTRNCFNILTDQNAAYLRTLGSFPLVLSTNNQERLTIASNGISTFSCQVCVSQNLIITGEGMFINRPTASSGEPYIFWQKNGVNRGSIYGADNTAGLRYFADVNIFYGNVIPDANNTRCLGNSNCAWAHIYTNDLHLSNMNKCGGNDIDGTNGDWTIQEGAENLYIINNKNNKKFKIQLQEII